MIRCYAGYLLLLQLTARSKWHSCVLLTQFYNNSTFTAVPHEGKVAPAARPRAHGPDQGRSDGRPDALPLLMWKVRQISVLYVIVSLANFMVVHTTAVR